ncbi:hypothetical protein R1flu_005915 [Riccia fluitans]|uniref:Aminotransferase-like plant mobile domain-containing protein n=1 Tax=Riccia fluitans TaxID=41844 RepID=A0ABD1YUI8_9MARC
MHSTLDKYNPRSYLPASVETNLNKKLVNGQRYEEILYYKDAAPYGPTYHLMTTVAELFWSAERSNRFLTSMILAYLCGLHGHSYNWAKAILHGLRTEILFLQSKARSNEGGKTIPVVWAPCFVHILFGLRRTLFAGTPLEEAEGWRCKLPEEIPIASPKQPVSTRRPRAEDKQPEEIPIASPEQPVSCQRPEEIPIASSEQPVSSKRPVQRTTNMDFRPQRRIRYVICNKPLCVQQNEGQNNGMRTRFTQPSRPNLPIGVTTPQPVQSSGERSESKHTPTGAILVKDLNGTSNEDSPAKPPNVSIPLPTPSPITTILIGEPGHLPSTERQSIRRIQRHSAATDTWKKAYEDQLSKVRELLETNDGLRGQVAAKDAEKSDVHALAWTEVQRELEELKRSVTELEDFKRSVTAKEKVAEETHLQKLALVQTELEEYKWSSEASIKRLEEEALHFGKH